MIEYSTIVKTTYDGEPATKCSVVVITPESLPSFIQLLNRALNTWDDAPPELKALADQVIFGEQLQDYSKLPR